MKETPIFLATEFMRCDIVEYLVNSDAQLDHENKVIYIHGVQQVMKTASESVVN